MKSRERMVTALKSGTPDRVPVYDFLFSLRFMQEKLGYTTELYDGATQVKLAGSIGLDGVFVPINGYCGFEDEPHPEGTKYVDEWGVTYIKNGWPVMAQIDVALTSRKDWESYSMPKPDAPHRLNMIKDAVKANTGEIAILVGLLGPFTMAYWYFFDLANLSLLVYDDPELIHEVNDAYCDWILSAAQLAFDAGKIDAFILADDWGGTNALLMSPAHLREFFIPPFRKIVEGLKRFSLPILMHNDGNLWAVLDDLVDTGINGYHPVERAASMELGKVKELYKGRLCPVGNINNKTTMVNGTPEDVTREAMECMKTAAPGGGYILATDHSIHDDIPNENVYAYIEAAKKYGTYPLTF